MSCNKVLLTILDGWGYREESAGNAIIEANPLNYNALVRRSPMSLLEASGTAVGLPQGVMGNSEVGHMNIGCGRPILQDQVRIDQQLQLNTFFETDIWGHILKDIAQGSGRVHLVGLVSDGRVHSAESHYLKMLDALKGRAKNIFFHAITDGRDTPQKSAMTYITPLESKLTEIGGQVGSVSGRFYAMDRDQRWERTELAYQAIVCGAGKKFPSAQSAIECAYQEASSDEFIKPVIIGDFKGFQPQDVIIFFNYRADRMRQIASVVGKLKRPFKLKEADYAIYTMTRYDETYPYPILLSSPHIDMSLGQYLSDQGLKQYRAAETEKYAHVTFFFNGGREQSFEGETRKLVPSPRVTTYDQTPAMNAFELTGHVSQRLKTKQDDLMVVNYAQPDMIGHTGNYEAALEAVKATDRCLEQLIQHCDENDYIFVLTADHGNIEMMRDPKTGEVHTAHTLNPVPFIVHHQGRKVNLVDRGSLSSIAPTLLGLMNLTVPKEIPTLSLLR